MACGCCCGGNCGEHEEGLVHRIGEFFELFTKWPFVLISGLCVLTSFVFFGGSCHEHGSAAHYDFADPALAAVLISGIPMGWSALASLFGRGRVTSALLITIAMVACISIGQLFAAGEVAFIMALGELLENLTLKRARKGLQKLVSLVPEVAHVKTNCPKCIAAGILFKDAPVDTIAPGDVIKVMRGETIPVDGIVAEGESSVDQSVMTGESMPVDKKAGDEVYSGTFNRFGELTITVTKAGEDSSLQKLVKLVKEAESRQAPMQRIADKWAALLVPVSLTIAVLTFAGAWLLLGDVNVALVRGVTIMVVFCPCALALATPTSIMAAIGQATKFGVIVKSGEALEKMGGVNVICFDKTGTLQSGESLREGAAQTIAELKSAGVRSMMISGDHEEIARRFAAEAGIDEVRFECLPEDKSRIVEELQAKGERVAMVGDGVNDALALKLADVGIAMGGTGTDIAQEYGDVSLVKDDLTMIPYLKRLSAACVRLIKINIAISMGINLIAIICSMLGILTPVTGALVHNAGSVLVVLNAALLYDRKFR